MPLNVVNSIKFNDLLFAFLERFIALVFWTMLVFLLFLTFALTCLLAGLAFAIPLNLFALVLSIVNSSWRRFNNLLFEILERFID